MAAKLKAYVVLERFEGYKEQLVVAYTGEEAKEKCRRGQIVECWGDDGPHPAGINSVRREPAYDPLADPGAAEQRIEYPGFVVPMTDYGNAQKRGDLAEQQLDRLLDGVNVIRQLDTPWTSGAEKADARQKLYEVAEEITKEKNETRTLNLTDDEIWALRNAVQSSIETTGETDPAEEAAYAKLVAAQDG